MAMAFDKFADEQKMSEVRRHLRAYLESVGFKLPAHNGGSVKCLFHDDGRNNSAAIFDHDRDGGGEPHFYCFQQGCIGRADIFKAIMRWEGCDFKTAKRRAFEFAGVELPQWSGGDSHFSRRKKRALTDAELIQREIAAQRKRKIF